MPDPWRLATVGTGTGGRQWSIAQGGLRGWLGGLLRHERSEAARDRWFDDLRHASAEGDERLIAHQLFRDGGAIELADAALVAASDGTGSAWSDEGSLEGVHAAPERRRDGSLGRVLDRAELASGVAWLQPPVLARAPSDHRPLRPAQAQGEGVDGKALADTHDGEGQVASVELRRRAHVDGRCGARAHLGAECETDLGAQLQTAIAQAVAELALGLRWHLSEGARPSVDRGPFEADFDFHAVAISMQIFGFLEAVPDP